MERKNEKEISIYMAKQETKSIKYSYNLMYEEIYAAARSNPKGIAYEFQGRKTNYETFVK